MFSDNIAGSGIHDANVRFRMYLVVTVAIFAFGSVLFWRTQLFSAAEYVELPDHGRTLKQAGRVNNSVLRFASDLHWETE